MSSFYCVNEDGVPNETTTLLRNSCRKRKVKYIEIDAASFDYSAKRQLAPGDLLYCVGTSDGARQVEQFLYKKGVATFYAEESAIYYDCSNPALVLQRAGLPVPRTVYCSTADRGVLRKYVKEVGGFPLVLKFPGWSRGIGVIRVDSFPSLLSVVDFALARWDNPLVCAYISNSSQWRLTVVGDRVVSAHRNRIRADDFRTSCSDDADDYAIPPDQETKDLAVTAVQTFKLELGGVDILRDPHGRLYLLEVNFPVYYAKAQQMTGVDISGAIIEFLLRKAKRIS
jgi:hypothetical protein